MTQVQWNRSLVACACAASLVVAGPARAGDPEGEGEGGDAGGSETLNDQATKHVTKAIEHFNNGAYVDSEEEFRRAAYFAPKWRPLHFNLGVLAEAQGKIGTAVTEYRAFRPLASPDEQMLVDQRIDELSKRKRKIGGAYKRQIALSATAMTLGVGGIAGAAVLFVMMSKNTKKAEDYRDQAAALEAMMAGSLDAMALNAAADDLDKKKSKFLYGGVYLGLFGLLAVAYSFIPLTRAIKSKRELDGIALGPTRLKWNGGAGLTLRF